MKKSILSCFFILIIFNSILALPQNGEIKVLISNIKSDDGEAIVTLFKSKEGFPDDQGKAFAFIKSKIKGGNVNAVFKNIPLGTYAIGVLHDENSNGVMDTKPYSRTPEEGVGVSNNAKGINGPPSFEDSKFKLDSNSVTIEIKVEYLQ